MPRVKQVAPPPRAPRAIARPSRLKLWLRRQRRNVRFGLFGIVGFAVVLVGMVVSHSAQRGGELASLQERFGRAIDLRVQDIQIDGRANTPEPLLRAALGVSKGDHILGFSVEGARQRIESLAWVEHVAVERRLPNTIYVALTERRPFAIWQYQGKFQLIDRGGDVVADEDVAAFSDLPVVVGLGAPTHASDMLNALGAVPDIRGRTEAVVRVGERRWNLQLKNGITVMLPENHEAVALARLADLQTHQQLLDRPLVFVDLRLPDRLAVRAKPAPTPAPTPDAKPAEPPHDPSTRRAT